MSTNSSFHQGCCYYYYSSASFYFASDDQNPPPHSPKTIPVPIDSPSDNETLARIPVHLPPSVASVASAAAAAKIQAAYRGHLVRSLVGTIRAVDSEAGRFERLIQRQETVDAVRRDERERLRVSEGLMALLLRLDAVPGVYPAVRDLRRAVSRRIVGLQEILDAVAATSPVAAEGFPGSLDEIVAGIWRGVEEEEEDGGVGVSRSGGFECWERFVLGV
ncbi:BAG family molecular chaperone regulator 5, mitochondrial [Ananas comosus]|uniref:BAG family molecular chaperone regulator 5, mitochondrial n=2 Tax=Ananas comosus TaxID=4615 RepID=A0A199VDX5_ANACO|nr:BAG family molecular chaperone regulator 5, mitochondrial [Ananas comosus]OAY75081.1 BAG family molecular chaperone regulator 5, mitochondrial [Ananas comosus]